MVLGLQCVPYASTTRGELSERVDDAVIGWDGRGCIQPVDGDLEPSRAPVGLTETGEHLSARLERDDYAQPCQLRSPVIDRKTTTNEAVRIDVDPTEDVGVQDNSGLPNHLDADRVEERLGLIDRQSRDPAGLDAWRAVEDLSECHVLRDRGAAERIGYGGDSRAQDP